MDNDPCGKFNYSSVKEIPKEMLFKLIVANQFFEHLNIQDSIDIICRLCDHLDKNGHFISTVPNIYHPVRIRGDITHVTFWDYKALYTLYKYANLDTIEILKYSKRYPEGVIERIFSKYMNRIYRIDWCDSIFIAGIKR